ncbi:MAG: UbiD family decarboxylase [Thermodesulfobacteriota bacterium]
MEQSLRATLTLFEATGDLRYVDRPVDPRYELGAVLALRPDGPTLFFRRVTGYGMPVVGNLLNTRRKMALGLGLEPEQLQGRCLEALDKGCLPEITAGGAVQEEVIPDPGQIAAFLPVPTWFELEAGPYISAGVIVAKDVETGRRNVSIARLRLETGGLLLAGIAPTHHLAELARRAGALGRPLEIAVCLGNHPAVLLASQMYVDLGHDEFEIAGGLLGEPLRLARCVSVDLEVPAEAEIVLEGALYPNELIEEGFVSEFHGFYEQYGPGQAVRVQTITHRREPIYQAILPGYAPEHALLGGVAIEATTCRALRRIIPRVKRVFLTEGGMGRLHAVITMSAPRAGEGQRAIMAALAQTNLLKHVVVVDDDVDPADPRQVEWAMAVRFRGQEDLVIVPGVMADRCEPRKTNLTVTKIGLVATSRPEDAEDGRKLIPARPPREILERVRKNPDAW